MIEPKWPFRLQSRVVWITLLLIYFYAGGPLHLGDIEELGQARLPCIVCPWHSWKFCLQTGRLKFPHKKNITVGTYPVQVTAKGELYIGFKSLSTDYFNAGMEFWKADWQNLCSNLLHYWQATVGYMQSVQNWGQYKCSRKFLHVQVQCRLRCCFKCSGLMSHQIESTGAIVLLQSLN